MPNLVEELELQVDFLGGKLTHTPSTQKYPAVNFDKHK